jgi:hypothetical protein
LRDNRNKGSIQARDNIESEIEDVKRIVSSFNLTGNKSTQASADDLKELIPREVAKVKRALL